MSRRIELNGIETNVIEFIPRGRESPRTDSKSKIVIIPGNPGNADYYQEFAYHLFDLTQQTNAVSVISHAGHTPPVQKTGDSGYFSLRDQVDHKLAYLALESHRDANIVLIGHSMGCYVIQEMLKRLPAGRVVKSFYLFPTIERIVFSPNGRYFVSRLGRVSQFLLYYLTYFLQYCVPKSLTKAIIIAFRFRSLSPERRNLLSNSTVAILNPISISNILQLSGEEMEVISARDNEFYQNHIDNIVLYYGRTDGWVPARFHSDMLRDYPDSQTHLCEQGIAHAFVFNGPIRMAEWVYNRI